MKRVLVRYKVKPERVRENEDLVRAVYEELGQLRPEGLRYATFRGDDGLTFFHVASIETADGKNPLGSVGAFKRFSETVKERCDEEPRVMELTEIGSYRFL
jgi:hypothetical protein